MYCICGNFVCDVTVVVAEHTLEGHFNLCFYHFVTIFEQSLQFYSFIAFTRHNYRQL